MTGRVRTPALVLRARPLNDDDLLVDLLGAYTGRVSAVARGARKSTRRYGGPVELGSRVDADLTFKPGRDLHTLTRCEVVSAIRHIRTDFDRIAALAYMFELVRLSARDGQPDAAVYGLAGEIVDALERHGPSAEGVLLWEAALLAHLGYATSPGALAHEAGLADDAHAELERLFTGDPGARLAPPVAARVRQGFERLWIRAVGHAPRSGRFLDLHAATV